MAFVILNARGEYLGRTRGPRAWVRRVDDAKTWAKLGAARSAARLARGSARIQEVRLMLWGSAKCLSLET